MSSWETDLWHTTISVAWKTIHTPVARWSYLLHNNLRQLPDVCCLTAPLLSACSSMLCSFDYGCMDSWMQSMLAEEGLLVQAVRHRLSAPERIVISLWCQINSCQSDVQKWETEETYSHLKFGLWHFITKVNRSRSRSRSRVTSKTDIQVY